MSHKKLSTIRMCVSWHDERWWINNDGNFGSHARVAAYFSFFFFFVISSYMYIPSSCMSLLVVVDFLLCLYTKLTCKKPASDLANWKMKWDELSRIVLFIFLCSACSTTFGHSLKLWLFIVDIYDFLMLPNRR